MLCQSYINLKFKAGQSKHQKPRISDKVKKRKIERLQPKKIVFIDGVIIEGKYSSLIILKSLKRIILMCGFKTLYFSLKNRAD